MALGDYGVKNLLDWTRGIRVIVLINNGQQSVCPVRVADLTIPQNIALIFISFSTGSLSVSCCEQIL